MSKSHIKRKTAQHLFDVYGLILSHKLFKIFNTVIHTLCTSYLSFFGYVSIYFQSKIRCGVTEVCLHNFYIITTFKCFCGIIVSQIMEAFFWQSNLSNDFLKMFADGSVSEVSSKFVFKNKIWTKRIYSS